MSVKFFPLLAALLIVAGCSSDPAPIEQLGLTDQAIEQARTVGATEQVEEYRSAVLKRQRAQAAMAARAYKQARLAAEQAELDARLAEAQILTRKTLEQLARQQTRVERLRQQVKAAQ